MTTRTLWALLLLGLLALAGTVAVARAEEAEEEEKPAEDTQAYEAEEDGGGRLHSSSDIEAFFLFPDAPEKKLALGERATILINLHNKGDREFNVTHVGAHLHPQHEFSYFIQNFTVLPLRGVNIGPGEETSLEYRFQPDEALHPSTFWLHTWVVYNSSSEQFVTSVYNNTIELTEKSSQTDAKRLVTWALWAAGAGVAAYAFMRFRGEPKTKRAPAVERGTREESVRIYKPADKARAIKRKTSSKK